jgi:nicotinate-nucleotide adenylyltransferase
MLTLWYGGTFDPVHGGHLAIARAAASRFQVPVVLAPAADPPHRPPTGASAAQRARMLELAAASDPWLKVDSRELERAGPSWTVDTLHELRAELGPDAPLALLLGADAFAGLPDWKSWRQLPELAHFVVAARGGQDVQASLPEELAAAMVGRWRPRPEALAAAPAGLCHCLQQPLRMESATGVRASIQAADGRWRGWVPAAVASYIDRHGLYRQREQVGGAGTAE